jgi:hypothetical protein
MRGRNFILAVYIFSFCISFVSAGPFGDVFQKITGNVIAETNIEDLEKDQLDLITCEQVKEIFEKDFEGFEIPKAVPFKTETFNIFIDEEFFISMELDEKKVGSISCEVSEKPTYNIYVKSELILDTIGNKEEINPLDYYNENRKNGNLDIKPIGFGRKLKMGFINLGLKIASWFN